jgi:putative membrane protein
MNIFISGLAVFLADYLLPGVSISGISGIIIVAIVLGIVNTFIKPIVLFFTLPFNILTLGLFTFVVNAGLVLLVDWMVPDFRVENFWWALAFSLVLSLVNSFLHLLTSPR